MEHRRSGGRLESYEILLPESCAASISKCAGITFEIMAVPELRLSPVRLALTHPSLRGKAWQNHCFCAARSSQVFVIIIKSNTKIPLSLKNTYIWREHWGRSVQSSSLKELFNSNLRFSLNKAYIRQTSCNRDEREERQTRHGKGFINKSPAAHFVPACSLAFSQLCGFLGWSRQQVHCGP